MVQEQNTLQLLHLVSSNTGQIWAKGSPSTTPHSGHWGHSTALPFGWNVSVGLGGCLNACACLVGSDVNSVDFVDSGSAMRKTVARQNAKLEGGSSKPDFVIWEIEVPKVTSSWPAHHPALPYTATPGVVQPLCHPRDISSKSRRPGASCSR